MKSTKKYIILTALTAFLVLSIVFACHLAYKKGINEGEEIRIALYEQINYLINRNQSGERDYSLGQINQWIEGVDFRSFFLPEPIGYYKYNDMDFAKLYSSLVYFYNKDFATRWDYESAIVHLATNKFFSISAVFSTNSEMSRYHWFESCVTIDLIEGKAIVLDDLVHINDEFISLLKTGDLIKTDDNHESLEKFGGIIDFSIFTEDEIAQILLDCSRAINKDDIGNYYFKPSFYLSPNRICFANVDLYSQNLYISLDDIGEFLKVEKW